MGLVRLPCFFNRVQRIERYSTTSSKMCTRLKIQYHSCPNLGNRPPIWVYESFFQVEHNMSCVHHLVCNEHIHLLACNIGTLSRLFISQPLTSRKYTRQKNDQSRTLCSSTSSHICGFSTSQFSQK